MLAVAFAALVLQTAPQAAAPERLENPVWINQPAFSTEARTTRARPVTLPEGNVEITCISDVRGRLTNCRISSEPAPPPALGRAALDAARIARIQPHMINGQPAPATVIFGMEYKRPEHARP